ncbi:MAG: Ig-like domain-containing protein, partial [Verrucomicrobiales bacterium]|nr:Ig-like domain-containing protein [Verrucomicrobiales bacterium]
DLGAVSTDQDGDTLLFFVSSASGGVATLAGDGRTVLFSPAAGFAGEAGFEFQAADDGGISSVARVTVQVNQVQLRRLRLAERDLSLEVGQTAQLRLVGELADSTEITVARSLGRYRSTNPSVLGVTDTGDLVGLAPGVAVVIAEVGGLSVATPVTVGGPVVARALEFYPLSYSVAVGETRQLVIRERLPDEVRDRSAAASGASYFSSNLQVATVNYDGLVTAVANGSVDITMVLGGHSAVLELLVAAPAVGPTLVTDAGATVANTDGYFIRVGPDSFAEPTTVTITTRTAANLPYALPTGFQFAGGFQANFNGEEPLQGLGVGFRAQGYQPGDALFLFRPGKLLTAPGVLSDRWELVGRATVGADGIARTTSPPHPDVRAESQFFFFGASGGYMGMQMTQQLTNSIRTQVDIQKEYALELDSGGTPYYVVPGESLDLFVPLVFEGTKSRFYLYGAGGQVAGSNPQVLNPNPGTTVTVPFSVEDLPQPADPAAPEIENIFLKLGAQAIVAGDNVNLDSTPDNELSAHEPAHAVQVQLKPSDGGAVEPAPLNAADRYFVEFQSDGGAAGPEEKGFYLLDAGSNSLVRRRLNGAYDYLSLPVALSGSNGLGLALAGDRAYLLDARAVEPSIYLIDFLTGESRGAIKLPSTLASVSGVAVAGDTLYLLDAAQSRVHKVNIKSSQLSGSLDIVDRSGKTIDLGQGIEVDPGNGTLWLTTGTSLVQVDPTSGMEILRAPSGLGSILDLAIADGILFALAQGEILERDLQSGNEVRRYDLTADQLKGNYPGLAVAELPRAAYVVEADNLGDNLIQVPLPEGVEFDATKIRVGVERANLILEPGKDPVLPNQGQASFEATNIKLPPLEPTGNQQPSPPAVPVIRPTITVWSPFAVPEPHIPFFVFVANSGDDSVSVFDPLLMKPGNSSPGIPSPDSGLVATIPLVDKGSKNPTTTFAPQDVVLNRTGNYAFVANSATGTISVINTHSLDLVYEIELPAGARPFQLAIHPFQPWGLATDLDKPIVYKFSTGDVDPATKRRTSIHTQPIAVNLGGQLLNLVTSGFSGVDFTLPTGRRFLLTTPGLSPIYGADFGVRPGYAVLVTERFEVLGIQNVGKKPYDVTAVPLVENAIDFALTVRGNDDVAIRLASDDLTSLVKPVPANLRGLEPIVSSAFAPSFENSRGDPALTRAKVSQNFFDINAAESMVFSPDGRWAYVLFNNTFEAEDALRRPYEPWSAGSNIGILQDPLDLDPDLPTQFIAGTEQVPQAWGDEIIIDPTGRYLIATYKGAHRIGVYDLAKIHAGIELLRMLKPEALYPSIFAYPLEQSIRDLLGSAAVENLNNQFAQQQTSSGSQLIQGSEFDVGRGNPGDTSGFVTPFFLEKRQRWQLLNLLGDGEIVVRKSQRESQPDVFDIGQDVIGLTRGSLPSGLGAVPFKGDLIARSLLAYRRDGFDIDGFLRLDLSLGSFGIKEGTPVTIVIKHSTNAQVLSRAQIDALPTLYLKEITASGRMLETILLELDPTTDAPSAYIAGKLNGEAKALEYGRIYVLVDPLDKVEEALEDNNVASALLRRSGLTAQFDGDPRLEVFGRYIRGIEAPNVFTLDLGNYVNPTLEVFEIHTKTPNGNPFNIDILTQLPGFKALSTTVWEFDPKIAERFNGDTIVLKFRSGGREFTPAPYTFEVLDQLPDWLVDSGADPTLEIHSTFTSSPFFVGGKVAALADPVTSQPGYKIARTNVVLEFLKVSESFRAGFGVTVEVYAGLDKTSRVVNAGPSLYVQLGGFNLTFILDNAILENIATLFGGTSKSGLLKKVEFRISLDKINKLKKLFTGDPEAILGKPNKGDANGAFLNSAADRLAGSSGSVESSLKGLGKWLDENDKDIANSSKDLEARQKAQGKVAKNTYENIELRISAEFTDWIIKNEDLALVQGSTKGKVILVVPIYAEKQTILFPIFAAVGIPPHLVGLKVVVSGEVTFQIGATWKVAASKDLKTIDYEGFALGQIQMKLEGTVGLSVLNEAGVNLEGKGVVEVNVGAKGGRSSTNPNLHAEFFGTLEIRLSVQIRALFDLFRLESEPLEFFKWDFATGNAVFLPKTKPGPFYLHRSPDSEKPFTQAGHGNQPVPLSASAIAQDANEPNDTLAFATDLGVLSGVGQSDPMLLSGVADVDIYRLRLLGDQSSNSVLRVTPVAPGGLTGVGAFLLDSSGKVLGRAELVGGALLINVGSLSTGTYFLEIENNDLDADIQGTTPVSYRIQHDLPVNALPAVFADMTFVPGELRPGQRGEIEVRISNRGTAPSAPTTGRLTWSLDDRPDHNDAVIQSRLTVPVLQPGETFLASVPFEVPATLSLGNVFVVLQTDAAQTSAGSSAADRQAIVAIDLIAPRDEFEANDTFSEATDLGGFLGSQQLDNLSISEEDDVDIYGFRMVRPGISGDFVAIEVPDSNSGPKITLWGEDGSVVEFPDYLEVVGAGARGQISLQGLPAGRYYLMVESASGKPFTYSLELRSTLASATNLSAEALVAPDAPGLGQTDRVLFALANTGSTAIQGFTVEVFVNQNDILRKIGEATFNDALEAGKGRAVEIPVAIPNDLTPLADYQIEAVVRPLPGSDGTASDDTLTAPMTVGSLVDAQEAAEASLGFVDLGTVSGPVNVPGRNLHSATDVDGFQFRLRSNGQAGASIRMTHAVDRFPSLRLVGIDANSTVSLNETRINGTTVEISLAGIPAGLYQLVILPDGETVAMTYDLQMVFPAGSGINLAVDSFILTRVNASEARLETQIRNAGTASSGNFQIRYFASRDVIFGNADDVLLDTPINLTSLAADAVQGDQRQINLGNLPPGRYYIGVRVDPAGQITEASKADNLALARWTTLPPADLADNNDTQKLATPISLVNGNADLTGLTLDTPDDVDWYRFSLDAAVRKGAEVRVEYQQDEGMIDLSLFDESGALLTEKFGENGTVSVSLDKLAAGEYSIRVLTTSVDSFSSRYRLVVQVPAAPAPILGATVTHPLIRPGNGVFGVGPIDLRGNEPDAPPNPEPGLPVVSVAGLVIDLKDDSAFAQAAKSLITAAYARWTILLGYTVP